MSLKNIFEYCIISCKLLSSSVFFFLFSFITVFIAIFTINIVSGAEVIDVLVGDEIIFSFLSTIPCYLIGIHYTTEDDRTIFKNILLFFIILSIALFGIVYNVTEIKKIETVEYTTYIMLILSFIFTIISKFSFEDFKMDVEVQQFADNSRNMSSISSQGKQIDI